MLNNAIKLKELEDYGYAKLPLLTSEDCSELRSRLSFVEEKLVTLENSLNLTVHLTERTLKLDADTIIKEYLAERLNQHLSSFRILVGLYQCKMPREDSAVDLHQDWSYVDERYYNSYTIWIPLVDVNHEMGSMCFIPKTHRLRRRYRHSSIPWEYSNIKNQLLKFLHPITAECGEAIVFNNAILHASLPNLTNQLRPVVMVTVVPQDAPLKLFYYNKSHPQDISVFSVEDTYPLDYKHFFEEMNQVPQNASYEGDIPFDSFIYTTVSDFEEAYKKLF